MLHSCSDACRACSCRASTNFSQGHEEEICQEERCEEDAFLVCGLWHGRLGFWTRMGALVDFLWMEVINVFCRRNQTRRWFIPSPTTLHTMRWSMCSMKPSWCVEFENVIVPNIDCNGRFAIQSWFLFSRICCVRPKGNWMHFYSRWQNSMEKLKMLRMKILKLPRNSNSKHGKQRWTPSPVCHPQWLFVCFISPLFSPRMFACPGCWCWCWCCRGSCPKQGAIFDFLWCINAWRWQTFLQEESDNEAVEVEEAVEETVEIGEAVEPEAETEVVFACWSLLSLLCFMWWCNWLLWLQNFTTLLKKYVRSEKVVPGRDKKIDAGRDKALEGMLRAFTRTAKEEGQFDAWGNLRDVVT